MSNKVPLAHATKESVKPKSVAKPKDMILDPMGQWKHPGENTRIPSNEITMKGVPYPVLAKPNVGQPVMMQPGAHYTFPGADYVDEFPKFAGGGMVEATVDENGEPRCPDGYDYNSSTGYCEKKSSKCPDGYKPDGKGGCIEDRCQPGYVKDASGTCVPDTSGAVYVEDENDPRYQDYLTRRKLNHISNIENPEIRRNAYYNMKQGYDTYDQFYDPEKGYTFDNIKTEDGRTFLSGKDGYPVATIDNIDPNKGDYDSKREIYKGLTIDQAKDLEAYARSKGFDMGDRFDPYSDSNYEPDQFTEKYKPSRFDANVYYINSTTPNFSFNRSTGKYLQPDTAIVEDKINRERIKKYYPNITDEDINDEYATYYNSYISNIKDDYNSLWPQYSADPEIAKQTEVINRPGNITLEQHKKNIQDSAKAPNVINAPLNVKYDDEGNPIIKGRRTSYKPDLVQDWINSTGRVLPYYDAPTDNYKFVTQPKSAELIEDTQRAVPKFDEPELNLKKGNLPVLNVFGPSKDRKHIHYDNPFIAGTSNKPINWAPYSAALRAFTGYKKGDEKEYYDKVKTANAEGIPVDLKGIPLMGKTDLKHRRAYKKALKEYEKRLPEIELENEKRRQQYEQQLKILTLQKQAEEAKRNEAGIDPNALTEWKKGGGLKSKKYSKSILATNRLFAEHPLFEKPKKLSKKRIYDNNAFYYQDGGLTVGTSTSYPSGLGVGALANYVPSQMANLKLANSFKFKDVKTPLEVSVGTPIGGAKSRSNTYQGFMHPDEQKSAVGEQILTPEQIIQSNQANFSNWQSSNKGAPIDVRVKQSFFGVPQDKNNPLRGFASVQGGYHPQTGFNAGVEGGVNLVLSRNGQANRYFSNRGLIPKQTVFMPQLTMGYGVRQKQAGWKEDTLNEYENLLNQDVQNKTTGSIDYLNKEVKKGNLSGGFGNVAIRPQFTVESRPTRSPLTLHGTVGANVNLAGGNRSFGPEGSGVKAKTNVYGEVGARYPVDKLFDKKSKAKSKIQEVQDREQEYERERPIKPVEQKEPEEQTEWIGEHPRWLRDGGEQDDYLSPGFMELELSEDEIQEYAKGGYIVEDISVPSLAMGGTNDYQLGDEIDEATMKRLKKLGYTFEEI